MNTASRFAAGSLFAVASLVANTTDLAQWCELSAQDLDKVHAATELRPMSPQECRRMVDIQRELLRRVGQHHTLMLTLLPGVSASASPPPAPIAPMVPPPVGRVRRWLRRMVG